MGRQPYATGRVHQRPFTALDEFGLDDAAREAVVDVVGAFVDEAIEHTLALLGAATNTVGDYDTVEYELTARIVHHEFPVARRESTEMLVEAWRGEKTEISSGDKIGTIAGQTGDVADVGSHNADTDKEALPEEPRIPIGRSEPLWFDYRKWMRRYATRRRSARPSRLW